MATDNESKDVGKKPRNRRKKASKQATMTTVEKASGAGQVSQKTIQQQGNGEDGNRTQGNLKKSKKPIIVIPIQERTETVQKEKAIGRKKVRSTKTDQGTTVEVSSKVTSIVPDPQSYSSSKATRNNKGNGKSSFKSGNEADTISSRRKLKEREKRNGEQRKAAITTSISKQNPEQQKVKEKRNGSKKKKDGEKTTRSDNKQNSGHSSQIDIFQSYLDQNEIAHGLETGALLSGLFRVNAGDRLEAFITVEGIPKDVFIPGEIPQNRALEGDHVVICINKPSEWHPPKRLRQSNGNPSLKSIGRNKKGKLADEALDQENDVTIQSTYIKNVIASDQTQHIGHSISSNTPVWLETGLNTDIVAAPAMLVSSSGGELAMKLDEEPSFEKKDLNIESLGNSSENGGCGISTVDFLVKHFQDIEIDKPIYDNKKKTRKQSSVPFKEVPNARSWSSDVLTNCINVAQLLETEYKGWQPTGRVVGITKKSKRRETIIGILRYIGKRLLLIPCDSRMPKMTVKVGELKQKGLDHLLKEAKLTEDGIQRTILLAKVQAWEEFSKMPHAGEISEIGKAGNIAAETQALLASEQIKDDDGFTEDILRCLPSLPWKPTEFDVESRRDFRSQRVFSIDPPTARDLDDALSIEVLENGLLRIGVHIADVSYFVRPETALDVEALDRSTSVYLVDRVIPMLPRALCEDLCSLNPGVDRLSMSVVWDMDQNGDVQNTWIGRTIIRSCVKLSYPQVQELIENRDSKTKTDVLGDIKIYDNHSWSDIVADCLRLHDVAQCLRRKRFSEGGALRLDNTKLYFELDEEGNPTSFGAYVQKEANRLVEEFMLKANMSAAEFISKIFPQRALLRCHPPPSETKMKEVAEMINSLLPEMPRFDVSSAGKIHESLTSLREALLSQTSANPDGTASIMEVVTLLCTKPMQLAKYFCTADEPDPLEWRHYALSVGHYTHFTSPIRRYPDIVVHRLIMAALEVEKLHNSEISVEAERSRSSNEEIGVQNVELSNTVLLQHKIFDAEKISEISSHANDRKLAAKSAQDGSLRLYLSSFLLEQPQIFEGLVAGLGGHLFFDAFVPELGMDVRVWTEDSLKGGLRAMDAKWKATQKMLLLSIASDKVSQEETEPEYNDIPNIHNLRNPKNLGVCQMPIEIKALTRIPLILGARLSKDSGSPSGICAKIFLDQGQSRNL